MDATATPLPSTPLLRVLGRQLDGQAARALRLEVRGAELRLAAWLPTDRRRHATRLAAAELVALLPEARRHRETPVPPRAGPGDPAALGYQEALRLVGQHLERRGAHLIRLIEHSDGLIVQGATPGGRVTTELLRWPALAVQHRQAVRQRRAAA